MVIWRILRLCEVDDDTLIDELERRGYEVKKDD